MLLAITGVLAAIPSSVHVASNVPPNDDDARARVDVAQAKRERKAAKRRREGDSEK